MKNGLEAKLSLSQGICFIFTIESKCARNDSWKCLMMKNDFVFVGNLLKNAHQSADSLFANTLFLAYQNWTEVITCRLSSYKKITWHNPVLLLMLKHAPLSTVLLEFGYCHKAESIFSSWHMNYSEKYKTIFHSFHFLQVLRKS